MDSRTSRQRLRELEELVVDAWPAADTEELDGWLLRQSGGPTRRGNSISTLDFTGVAPVEQRIAEAEAWYQARGQAPVFQLGPCVQPKELDALLAARGYEKSGATAYASAETDTVLARTHTALTTRVSSKLEPAWLALCTRASRFAADLAGFQGFLKRLGTRCRFACSFDADGSVLACCLGIASEDRLGIYAMLSAPEARGRGAARALLHALAQSAQAEAMRELYLLVELDNEPARALYRSAGFADVYEYWYRARTS